MDIINSHPNEDKYSDEYIRIFVDIVDWKEDFILIPEFKIIFFNWDEYGFLYYTTINTKDFILSLDIRVWRDAMGIKISIPKKITKKKRFLDRIMVF